MKPYDSAPLLALYATSGCHLCEQADALIRRTVTLSFRTIEITDDDNMLQNYGLRIPVLRRLDTGEELNWPFDAPAIQRLMLNRE
ncbi:MAG TPA: glutaredoxin family protein [Candidatus Competibacteraceae bacterium]|mgnify:FL=1|nr:glutaredoxin family protein [Candidatus Competibacteraceae bacterium]